MVIIISEDVDITTKIVIDWLLFHNENYKILGSNRINTIDNFTISNNKLTA